MRFIKQFLLIILISFIGEILNRVIPLPIPASIYGLVLMFCALKFKVFPLAAVKETSAFLIDIMPLTFIAPGVALLENLDVLKNSWWKIVIICILTTILVMGITGVITQAFIRLGKKKSDGGEK